MSKQSKLYSQEHHPSGLRLFQSLTFYQVWFVMSAWQPGSLGVWMVYFITAGSMAENLYKWWQAGWLQPELREHCAGTYWYKYSKTGYIWYDTNTQETLITSQGNHNNAHNQIVKETYQEINEETLVIHQLQLIIFFLFVEKQINMFREKVEYKIGKKYIPRLVFLQENKKTVLTDIFLLWIYFS